MSIQSKQEFTKQVREWVAEAKAFQEQIDEDVVADALLSVTQLVSSALEEHDASSSASCNYLYGVVWAVEHLHRDSALHSDPSVSALYKKLQGLNPAGI